MVKSIRRKVDGVEVEETGMAVLEMLNFERRNCTRNLHKEIFPIYSREMARQCVEF